MCCQSRAEWYLTWLCCGCAAMSVLAAVPMFILNYPGDECLLFVGVRGEALIYGNPAGCYFVACGHCFVIVGIILLLGMLFCCNRKGRSQATTARNTASNRTLPGTLVGSVVDGNAQYNPWQLGLLPSASMDTIARRRFARLYSGGTILLCGVVAAFVTIVAAVIVGGYVVSCSELQYETRRQLYGRTTLGVPIKDLNIACYSVFRDVDFHSRFHFDHYEYSGQWHGQYRGFKHGRVHRYESDHEHIIGVAAALEMSIAGSTIGALLWLILLAMLVYLRFSQKREQAREVAESLEDARIYASSRDQMQHVGRQKLPTDQLSVCSQQSSSILSQKPDYLTNPNGTASPSSMATYAGLSTQGSQIMNAQVSGVGPQTVTANNVQYVQLSSGVLVPLSNLPLLQQQQQQQQQQHAYAQLLHVPSSPPSQGAGPVVHQQQLPGAQSQPVLPQTTETAFQPQGQHHMGALPQQQQQQLVFPQQQQQLVFPQQQQQLVFPQQQQRPIHPLQQLPLQEMSSSQVMLHQQQVHPQQQHQQVVSPQAVPHHLSPIQTPGGIRAAARPRSPGGSLPRTSSRVPPTQRSPPPQHLQDDDGDGECEVPNNRLAQRKQVHLSKDVGMKCSQI